MRNAFFAAALLAVTAIFTGSVAAFPIPSTEELDPETQEAISSQFSKLMELANQQSRVTLLA
jgi:hypothetical protein